MGVMTGKRKQNHAATAATWLLGFTLAVATVTAGHQPATTAPLATPADAAHGKPVNIPAWEPGYGARFVGCVKSLPKHVVPSSVVVVDLTGDVKRMNFDKAIRVTHNDSHADDVWVVGACA